MRGPRKVRPWALAALPVAAALALFALPASAQATSPWWSLEAGSRPTNLKVAPDQTEVQEVRAEKFNGEILAAKIEVGGEVIGCLGAGELVLSPKVHPSANSLCESQASFPAAETPAELESVLEGPYGKDVEVSGGPVGTAPLLIVTPHRWVASLALTPLEFSENPLGVVDAKIISEGSGRLFITATNLGDAPLDATSTPLRITDQLPEGVSPYGTEAFAGMQGTAGPVACAIEAGGLISCTFEGELPPYEAIELEVAVALAPGVSDGAAGQVTVSGGDGPEASAVQKLQVNDEAVQFGIEGFSMRAEEEGGKTTTQAGAHPFQLTQSLRFNAGQMHFTASGERVEAYVDQPAQPRNVRIKLPPGLVGDPSPIETCSFKQFTTQHELVNECPPQTAVGAASVTVIEPGIVHFARIAVPVFNLEPAYGEPARLGFMAAGVPVTIDTELRGSEAYAIGANVLDASQLAQVLASTVSIWGNPGDSAHDSSRGWGCVYFNKDPDIVPPCQRPSGQSTAAFLRMPVSCAQPLSYGIEIEPWNVVPGSQIAAATDESPALSGCDLLPFKPTIVSTPTTKLAANPSGLDFELSMPNIGLTDPLGKSEAQPRKVEVALPEGMTANPSVAEGLTTCSEAQLKRETAYSKPGEGCPEAAKVGTVELETPLLEGRLLKGSVFLATPYENPSGSLIALYMTIREPSAGVLVTQSLQVKPDPATGQLVTVAEEIPQLPFSDLRLHLRSGGRPPLISAPRCGTWQTRATLYPYSVAQPVIETAPSEILAGPQGGACPPGGAPPFAPGFEAGSVNNAAGAFSPFDMRLTRKDGEQDMTRFSTVLPPGVLGRLAGLTRCPEAAIAKAKSRTGPHGAQEEIEDPSCPASSKVGRTLAGAGAGSDLTYVPGSLYLAGPLAGDPLSVVAITPAKAGPFDVGTVVVREALTLNPRTAEVEVDGSHSDPIPHILKGIPLSLRDLRVYADRPEFTLNPTSCAESSTRATLFGSNLSLLDPSDDVPVGLASRYQAADCDSLGFKPKLAINLKGGTKRGAHPALKAVVTPRKGDANFSGAVVTLPHSAFLDQAHIRTICTRVQFAANGGNGAGCPAGAVYGHAKAWTPLLDAPLEGPVFLRSSDHNLPDLVLALHGLVNIDLASRIDSVHGGIRSSFEDVPDAPVSRFVLEMQGGKKGLIVNSTDLCAGTHRAKADLTGQNGRAYDIKPALGATCPKQHKGHKPSPKPSERKH